MPPIVHNPTQDTKDGETQVRQPRTRHPAIAALLLSLVASLLTFTSASPVQAAESIPALPWPAVEVSSSRQNIVTHPSGSVTRECAPFDTSTTSPRNLKTYDTSGQIVQDLPYVDTCLSRNEVGNDDTVYGYHNSTGTLQAYSGNTKKWEYAPNGCQAIPTVGVNGNLYMEVATKRLIALAPELEPGETQPTKVMDVPIDVGVNCGADFTAFKHGLYVRQPGSTPIYHFYSYSGKKLAQIQTARRPVPDGINAEGRLFFASGDQVKVFNPLTNTTITSLSLAEAGQTVNINYIYPTPDGGAVVLADTSTGPEIIKIKIATNLVTVTKDWTVALPTSDSEGNQFGSYNQGVVDTSGKFVLVRQATLVTNGLPNSVPAVGIGVFAITDGELLQSEILRGNLDTADGGLSGYTLSTTEDHQWPVVGPDTAYVKAQCAGSGCSNTNMKLYPIEVPGLELDYPRSAVLNATPRPSSPYIAIGDSFSAGISVNPHEADTTIPDVNECYRSELAYPNLISGEGDVPALGSDGFRACSGAVTTNITDLPQWNEGIQLDWTPDPTTEVVTLTIGGNDIGFVDFARDCVFGTCQEGSSAYNTALGKINNELPGKLKATYERILAYAPNAEIYVVGYPHVIADKSPTDPSDGRCIYMRNDTTPDNGAPGYPWEDAWAARDIVTKLNTTILAKVNEVDPTQDRLHFVDANGTNSPFTGNEVCGTNPTSFFQNVDEGATNVAYVFHPNTLGQEAYAELVENEINAG